MCIRDSALADVKTCSVEVEAASEAAIDGASAVAPVLFGATAEAVTSTPRLRTEIFGPAVLAVACRTVDELRSVIASLEGHLTATVHGDGGDFAAHGDVCTALQRKVGRLIANGVPTGVEVSPAMVHGGPYPAATDARFSAVGTTSIARWVRPVCYQDWPHAQLPPELRDDNPHQIRQLVDGVAVEPKLSLIHISEPTRPY